MVLLGGCWDLLAESKPMHRVLSHTKLRLAVPRAQKTLPGISKPKHEQLWETGSLSFLGDVLDLLFICTALTLSL